MNEKYPLALPEGTVLAGQYIIEKVLGQGGFGITYEATDYKTKERVAVKEFFPDAMATRTNQTTVSAFSGERGESFAYGKTCFLQEAETLARFIGNENIVRIHSYFEENETAYFVMDFIEGTSFDEYLRQQGGKISFEEAARILVPVMDALSAVHSQGIVHRDVTPDNIYITAEGVVKLLDFGAARYSLGDKSRSLDIILKHGFAPKEQYTRRGKQGPYTDVYALGATFYFALTGKRPPDSVERMDEDDLVPPSSLGVQISDASEDAILQALSVQPADRFQSMMAFKNALYISQQEEDPQPALAAVGSTSAVSQTYFTAPEQSAIPYSESVGSPAPGTGQDADLQDLAATMKTAGKLAGKLAGKMAGKMAEKTAETAGIMAGTAGKMSEIMAAKKAETAEKLAAKMAEREAEKAAQQSAAEAAGSAAENAAEGSPESTIGRTVGAVPPVSSTPAKPAMNKSRLLIVAVVIAVVLIGIFVLKRGADAKSSTDPTPDDPPVEDTATDDSANEGPDATDPFGEGTTPIDFIGEDTPSDDPSDEDTTPDDSPSDNFTATPTGSFKPVGNNTGNMMNDGLISVDYDGNSYWVDDSGHSVSFQAEDISPVFENEEENFRYLSYDDGKLFFWYGESGGGSVYAYNPDTQNLEDIPYLADFNGSIIRLFLTEDYYVIGCWDKNGDDDFCVDVYLVSRTTGQQFECCTAYLYNAFTISDDGFLYYVGREDDVDSECMAIYSVNMATSERKQLVYTTGPDYAFYCPVVVDGYLYFSICSKTDYSDYNLVRIDRVTGYGDDTLYWDIDSKLELERESWGRVEFNVNVKNHVIYFYLYDAGTAAYYLYEVKGYDDDTFDIEKISDQSYRPNVVYYGDGSYQLNYLHYVEDDSTYQLYYRDYDANGNYIKNN